MSLLKLLKKKIVVFDGAMGTSLAVARNLQITNPSAEGGSASGGNTQQDDRLICSEAYNLYAPEIVEAVHRSFIEAGCDLIETNTFNANRISLAEHRLEDHVEEINRAAVQIAKRARKGSKVLISGDLGPTGKLPSMGQITFDEMCEAYKEQVRIFVDEGLDAIQIDTCQDILQTKAAVVACNGVFEETGKRLPLVVTVTIDQGGKLLLGTEPEAVVATLVSLGVDIIGLNCGLGPEQMEGAVRYLVQHSPLPVAVIPNAGLPEIVDGETTYNLGAKDFAEKLSYYVEELGVQIVGGCCGTTPDHMVALIGRVNELRPKKRNPRWRPSVSSLFQSRALKQEPAPTIIGERMNVNGSKKFRETVLADDFDQAVQMVADQEAGGSHLIDISVAYAGRNEISDFQAILSRVVGRSRLPICIDSTSIDAIETSLKLIPGRSLINSINLEDGGEKASKILKIAKRFGSALIALTIDEDGMAREKDHKLKIAKRLITLAKDHGIDESDLLIDLLTFTLAEPRAASFGSGARTLKAIKALKKKHPNVGTVLGVSNISFGLKRSARKILNSVFLNEAIKAGLDAAIVHAGQIIPVASLDEEVVETSLDLIWNRRPDALDRFIAFFEGKSFKYGEVAEGLLPEEGILQSILQGDRSAITEFIDQMLGTTKPRDILNGHLMPAMGEVGRRFDRGEIPLPFVLQSAEVMKRATDHLAPHFEKSEVQKKGKVVLATVRGDVHDIGKNLVDIVLSNNGYDVVNIGVKQPIEEIIMAATNHGADIIGLSGLLVESALIMKDDLAEMEHRGVKIPVICGGAALTEAYVKKELASVYSGNVYYAGDAFHGLKICEELVR